MDSTFSSTLGQIGSFLTRKKERVKLGLCASVLALSSIDVVLYSNDNLDITL